LKKIPVNTLSSKVKLLDKFFQYLSDFGKEMKTFNFWHATVSEFITVLNYNKFD